MVSPRVSLRAIGALASAAIGIGALAGALAIGALPIAAAAFEVRCERRARAGAEAAPGRPVVAFARAGAASPAASTPARALALRSFLAPATQPRGTAPGPAPGAAAPPAPALALPRARRAAVHLGPHPAPLFTPAAYPNSPRSPPVPRA